MEWDEETNIAPPTATSIKVASRKDPLPWVLFLATLVAFIGTSVFLAIRARAETERANDEYVEKTQAVAAQGQAQQALDGEKVKSAALAEQVKALTAEKEALAAKLKAAEAKAPAEVKTASKKPVGKKPPPKKTLPKKRK